jgi:hypothetical protein
MATGQSFVVYAVFSSDENVGVTEAPVPVVRAGEIAFSVFLEAVEEVVVSSKHDIRIADRCEGTAHGPQL